MNLRIPLGTYGLDEGKIIQAKFNELRNKYPERSQRRLNAHILLRGRGCRKLYEKWDGHEDKEPRYYRLSKDAIPLKYAQRVALYLIIDVRKFLIKR